VPATLVKSPPTLQAWKAAVTHTVGIASSSRSPPAYTGPSSTVLGRGAPPPRRSWSGDCQPDATTSNCERVGRFGRITDPEDTRIELWQPA